MGYVNRIENLKHNDIICYNHNSYCFVSFSMLQNIKYINNVRSYAFIHTGISRRSSLRFVATVLVSYRKHKPRGSPVKQDKEDI